MELSELSHLVSLSMSYQAYVQELNAANIRQAESGRQSRLSSSFGELLQQIDIGTTTSGEWRNLLVAETVTTADAASLDQISIAVEKSAGHYNKLAEGYTRVLNIYRTGLGRG